jgi:hypothetical protein
VLGSRKKARDLLYKDYNTDQKFTLTTYTSSKAVSFHIIILLWVGVLVVMIFCCPSGVLLVRMAICT